MKKLNLFILLALNAYLVKAQRSVDFLYFNNLIFFQVKVNEADSLLFLFDTGANMSAIDAGLARKLLLPEQGNTQVEGSTGNIQAKRMTVDSLVFGGIKVKKLIVTGHDLSGSLAPPGKRISGILGTDFFKQSALLLDFEKRKASLNPKLSGGKSRGIPFCMPSGIPTFSFHLNDNTIALRYDSGASLFETKDVYINLPQRTFHVIKKAEQQPLKFFTGTSPAGKIKLPVYHLQSLKFDRLEFSHVFVILQAEAGYFARSNALGFFSNNLLQRAGLIMLDFKHKRLFIKP